MSSSAIHLGYAELDFDQGTKGAKLNGKSKSAAVAFSHGLSKRTTLYTGYVYTDNDKDSVAAAPAGLTNLVGAVDRKNHTFTAGIRHTF
jgi:predicted porin